MRGNWRFAAARLRNSGEYAIIVVKMLWFLGDSVDSRLLKDNLCRTRRSMFLGDSVDSRLAQDSNFVGWHEGFWGIVWTAGLVQVIHAEKLWQFLGDSVDSRLSSTIMSLKSILRFWGIVWTAGIWSTNSIKSSKTGFWGIVWTAGASVQRCERFCVQRFWGIVWTAGS